MIAICSNQQQIINFLNIDKNPKEINLLILDFNEQNYDIYLKLMQLNYFKTIHFLSLKRYMTNKGNKIQKLNNYFANYFKIKKHVTNYIESLNIKESVDIFACYPDLPTLLVIKIVKNKKKLGDVNLYDEGLYTYAFPNIKNRKNQFARYLTGINFEKLLKNIYVYEPSLLNFNNSIVHNIQKLNDNNPKVTLLKKVFDLNDVEFPNKVLFLDQPFPNSNNYWDVINRIMENEDVILKKHPRSILNNEFKQLKFNKAFELLLLSNNMNNKMLITFTSSAMMTPKIVFNQEPFIVFVYRLLDVNVGGNEIEKVIDKLKLLYREQEKILIPETIEELESIIKKFTEIGG